MAPSKKAALKSSKSTTSARKSGAFSEEELAAMRDYVKEKRGELPEGEEVVLAKISEMAGQDKAMGKRIHEIVKAAAPGLTPRLWYGMPAYSKDGKVLCYFQPGSKFKTRYSTLGFSDKANLDEGNTWPVVYALKSLTAAEEEKVSALVKKAAS